VRALRLLRSAAQALGTGPKPNCHEAGGDAAYNTKFRKEFRALQVVRPVSIVFGVCIIRSARLRSNWPVRP
jgi:hypothetical protein